MHPRSLERKRPGGGSQHSLSLYIYTQSAKNIAGLVESGELLNEFISRKLDSDYCYCGNVVEMAAHGYTLRVSRIFNIVRFVAVDILQFDYISDGTVAVFVSRVFDLINLLCHQTGNILVAVPWSLNQWFNTYMYR